jgi:hypothetical protein
MNGLGQIGVSIGGRRSRRIGSILASVGLVAGMLAATTGSAAAVTGGAPSLTCSGGNLGTFTPELIPSGTYRSLTVTGFCEVEPGARIIVTSGVIVAPGAFLVASGALDNGMAYPDCNRTIAVSGGIRVGAFGSLFLGDGPGSGCDPKTQTTVGGGLNAAGPLFLVVHGVTVNGGLSSVGGGDNQPCNFAPGAIPTYSTIEDSQINGGATVSGYQACFLGFIRNHVNGTVRLTNNSEPTDEIDIGANVVHGNLLCSGNVPLENTGGSPSSPSQVTGHDTCNGT